MWETCENERQANAVNKAIESLNFVRKERLKVLIQVNTSEEESKGGVMGYEQVSDLAKHIIDNCCMLQFAGLMTIGSKWNYDENQPDRVNPDFIVSFMVIIVVYDYVYGYDCGYSYVYGYVCSNRN